VAQIKKGTASLEQLQRLKDDLEASEYLGYDYKLFNPFDDEIPQNLAKVADEAIPKKESAQSAKAQLRSHFSGKKLTDTQRAELRAIIEKEYNITPIKEFGTNYAEYYHDGKGAVKKLLIEKQGQVAGAFYKYGLGDIDLVWGKTNDELNGFGLEKIAKKHLGDFVEFNGVTPYEKLANGLNEIIKNGEVADKNGVKTILYNNKDKVYAVGLSKGWHGNGENEWVITAYEKKNFKNGSGDSKTISAYAEIKEAKTPASTADNIIPQNEAKGEVSLKNSDDFIPFSHPVIGGGLFGGALNGVSRDENGDVSLNFDDFIKGFFGGAVGAKLASAGLKKSAPNLYKKFMGYANKYPKMAQTNPELLGTMLRSGRDSELKELERNLR
ncbi:hypothetical protein NYG85_11735, partial [Campylobacter sp. PS10]|nr:hypothetical protein [Campylobacter gastrosuis]